MGRTRSELLSDVNEDTRPFKRQAHNAFEAYFSSDAAALVEHTRRCVCVLPVHIFMYSDPLLSCMSAIAHEEFATGCAGSKQFHLCGLQGDPAGG
jgi:hypothetical protein